MRIYQRQRHDDERTFVSAKELDPLPVWARGIEGQVALVTGAGRGLGRA